MTILEPCAAMFLTGAPSSTIDLPLASRRQTAQPARHGADRPQLTQVSADKPP
jgi:hypothetical protein